jgi:hypothetical protein
VNVALTGPHPASEVPFPKFQLQFTELADVLVKFTVNGIHPVVTSGTNDGKICAPISTVMVAVVAQIPALGVNVYVVVAVLLIAGDHDPEMELVEVVGSVKFAPEQSGANWLKLGTIGSFTVTVIEYGRAHSLASGVKV